MPSVGRATQPFYRMRDILIQFVTIHPLNHHPLIPWVLVGIWLVMLGNCFASLRQQPIEPARRFVWLMIILLIPILGMLAYLIYCLFKADYSFMKFVMGPPKSAEVTHNPPLRLPAKGGRAE